MKVIFLDFDGVITTPESHYELCPKKMALLKKIVDATDAKIVISSSWRRTNLEDTIKHITDTGNPFVKNNPFILADKVVGITHRMFGFIHPHKDRHCKIPRGVEINAWVFEHEMDIESYVILDDDDDMLYIQRNRFIHTDGLQGLTDSDVDRAIDILTNKPYEA